MRSPLDNWTQNDSQERRRWESITNPAARQIVEEAYRLSRLPHSLLPAVPYRYDLKAKLENSDLAQRLPDWPQSMPDISDALPWPMRLIERKLQPRNYRQLTTQVIRFLDWYLDPRKRSGIRRTMVWYIVTPLTLVLALTAVPILQTIVKPQLGMFEQALGLLGVMLTVYASTRIGLTAGNIDPNTALTFYYYVRDAYSPPPDEEPAAVEA